jgi:hypothetical protein
MIPRHNMAARGKINYGKYIYCADAINGNDYYNSEYVLRCITGMKLKSSF